MNVHGQTIDSRISFVQASNIDCKVGRPNLAAGETVVWEGGCVNGLASGAGAAQWSKGGKPNFRFEGSFEKGLLEGKGKMTTAEGDRYEGDYRNGMRHGYGVYGSADGSRYEGEYQNNQRNGTGTIISATGQRTRVTFKDGTLTARLVDAESSAAASARQRAKSERQLQEEERRRVAEHAKPERRPLWAAELAIAAKVEAQMKAADREKARRGRIEQFAKKRNLLLVKAEGLYANPFHFEGDNLLLHVKFDHMQSATTGLFYLENEGILVVSDVPKGAFVQKAKIILGAKVLGNVRFDGVVLGILQVQGMVPSLKFLGALICPDDRCDEMDEK